MVRLNRASVADPGDDVIAKGSFCQDVPVSER